MQTAGMASVCVRRCACKCMASVDWTMKWKHPITISLHLSIRTSSMQRAHSWVAPSLFTITHCSSGKRDAEGGERVSVIGLLENRGTETQKCVGLFAAGSQTCVDEIWTCKSGLAGICRTYCTASLQRPSDTSSAQLGRSERVYVLNDTKKSVCV